MSIYSKSEIIDSVWLKLHCLDRYENLILKDSTLIGKHKEWMKYSLTVFPQKTEKLYIEIQAKSKDTIILNNKITQKIWIDFLQLKLDGRDIFSYQLPEFQFCRADIEEMNENIKVDENNLDKLYNIDDFKNHRIIALGESVHGSKEIQHFTFESIKHLISNNNCKLLLLELPFEVGLRVNDYVNGETSEDLEKTLIMFNYNLPEFKGLFTWIKNWNTLYKTKVNVIGIDINHAFLLENHLLAFLKNQKGQNDNLNAIIELIEKRKYREALKSVQKNQSLGSFLGKNKYLSIIHALRYRNNLMYPKPSLLEGNRDYALFQNAKFAINTYLDNSDKAVIYAHLGHVNKKNSFFSRLDIPNFGNYMKEQYRDDYFVSAFLIGNGTITNTDSIGYNSGISVNEPESGSLENLCLMAKDSVFYKNLTGVKSTYSCRAIGVNYTINQFYPHNHIGRFDALIFFKRSSGFEIPENYPKTNAEISKFIIEEHKKHPK